jgi:hypothetical protein
VCCHVSAERAARLYVTQKLKNNACLCHTGRRTWDAAATSSPPPKQPSSCYESQDEARLRGFEMCDGHQRLCRKDPPVAPAAGKSRQEQALRSSPLSTPLVGTSREMPQAMTTHATGAKRSPSSASVQEHGRELSTCLSKLTDAISSEDFDKAAQLKAQRDALMDKLGVAGAYSVSCCSS